MKYLKKFINDLLLIAVSIILLSAFKPIDKKAAALAVLRTKCNVCHKVQNRKKVFTPDNMNTLASKINEQVFIKKRMPRGKKIKLTQEEYNTLETWLHTIKK